MECEVRREVLAEEVVMEVKTEDITLENIVPSPATEDDPPSFPISTDSTATSSTPYPRKQSLEQFGTPPIDEDEYSTSIRSLRPLSSFDSFTLWTPDAPLAGFRADELILAHQDDAVVEGDQGVRLEKAWWRVGGAGEGGDDIVRAMGEWIGLVEAVGSALCFSRFFNHIANLISPLIAEQACLS